ncbi:MAG: N-acetylmuramidase family protein [Rhodopila sp.]
MTIQASVGVGGANKPGDVSQVQKLLRQHARWLEGLTVEVNGIADAVTCKAIGTFQRNAAAMLDPDSLVSPQGFTLRCLNRPEIPPPGHRVFAQSRVDRSGGGLTMADYAHAAAALACEVAAIQAVAQVETRSSAWAGDGLPAILFERHYFSRLTNHVFDGSHPDLSNPTPGGYGASSAQWSRLRRAAMLNESAALQSASWGAFQIMGANCAECGFGSVAAFIDAMAASEQRQLDAFVAFVKHDAHKLKAVQGRDWETFARLYNGPNYADNDYDTKLADAYAVFKAALARKQPVS